MWSENFFLQVGSEGGPKVDERRTKGGRTADERRTKGGRKADVRIKKSVRSTRPTWADLTRNLSFVRQGGGVKVANKWKSQEVRKSGSQEGRTAKIDEVTFGGDVWPAQDARAVPTPS